MNFHDVALLNQSIQNAGDDALKRRAMQQQMASEVNRQMLERELANQRLGVEQQHFNAQQEHYKQMEAAANARADAAGKPVYKWKSKGVEMQSHDLNELQKYPADVDETGKHSLTMSGTTPNGATVSKTISIPTTLQGDEETRKWGAQQIADFNQSFGVVPKKMPDKSSAVEAQQAELDRQAKLKVIDAHKEDWTPEVIDRYVKTGTTNTIPSFIDYQSPGAKFINDTTIGAVPINTFPQTTLGEIPPPAAQGDSTSEVMRVTKDGRKAIFDANTKQFLRYADEQ